MTTKASEFGYLKSGLIKGGTKHIFNNYHKKVTYAEMMTNEEYKDYFIEYLESRKKGQKDKDILSVINQLLIELK